MRKVLDRLLEGARRRQARRDAGRLQWIESGHRRVLVDLETTDTDEDVGTIYPAHLSADADAVVDVREVR